MSEIEKAREALKEALDFARQDFQALTPAGEAMVKRWEDALASLSARAETEGERERFEAWAKATGGLYTLERNDDGSYRNSYTFHVWEGWQARVASPAGRLALQDDAKGGGA